MFGQGRAKSAAHLPGQPPEFNPVQFEGLETPRFIVTVDTEEEFDWSSPFQRTGHGTRHIEHIPLFQSLCDTFGVRPIYLVDHPIATDPRSIEIFGGLLTDKRCEIGAQLHAWVTPPFEEEVNAHNSYASNLAPQLERQKIESLFTQIDKAFGASPIIYRAGRYGAGPNTMEVLNSLGVRIDSSVRSLFDYSRQHGPDYSDCSLHPYWLSQNRMFELPLTSVFAGILRFGGRALFGAAFEAETSRALLARARLLERIALTPEGIPLSRALEAIDIALAARLPVLNFSFHSPSLMPGNTPYVRNDADLATFYAWWTAVFEHLHKRGVAPASAAELVDAAK